MNVFSCLSFVIFVLILDVINGQLPDENVQSGPLDETSILKMGRQFGNPLLQLIGTAIKNSKLDVLGKICSLNRCGEWSEWSACIVVTDERFGMTTRSRECGKGPSFCKSNGSQVISIEKDSKVCIGKKCPANFTETDNGFCFLLQTTTMNRDDAGKFCKEKGSFVVNPNTQSKADDLHGFLRSQGITTEKIWLDARRKNLVSPWEYSSGMGPGNYSNWAIGQPNQNADEFCMAEQDVAREWYDRECHHDYVFVCEFL